MCGVRFGDGDRASRAYGAGISSRLLPGLPQALQRTHCGLVNQTQYRSDVIALVVLWRLRYKLASRDLLEMFAVRGIVFSHEAVRAWESKLTPALARISAGVAAASSAAAGTLMRPTSRWPVIDATSTAPPTAWMLCST